MTLNSEHKSRKEAFNLMRKQHPELDWHIFMVHHIDENPLNNDPSNLQIITKASHTRLHAANRNSNLKMRLCAYCKKIYTKNGVACGNCVKKERLFEEKTRLDIEWGLHRCLENANRLHLD